MADLEERRISDLTRALEVDSSALFEVSNLDESSESGYISMATDVETMAQKMLGGINFETQLQTTVKNIFGAINEVNKGSTPYDDTEIRQEISDIEEKIKGLSGLTDEQKQAILKDAEKQVWTDDKGEEYYVALYNALYPETPAETYITADDITPSSGTVTVNDEGTVTSENYTYAIKNFLNLELNIKTQSTYTSKWIETHPNAIVINQDGNNFVDLATAQSSSSYTVVGTVKDIQCYDKISAKLDNNTLTITYADGDTVSVTPANCIGIKETSWLHPYTYNVKKINLVIPDTVDINDYVTKETIDGVVAIEQNEEVDEIDVVEPSDIANIQLQLGNVFGEIITYTNITIDGVRYDNANVKIQTLTVSNINSKDETEKNNAFSLAQMISTDNTTLKNKFVTGRALLCYQTSDGSASGWKSFYFDSETPPIVVDKIYDQSLTLEANANLNVTIPSKAGYTAIGLGVCYCGGTTEYSFLMDTATRVIIKNITTQSRTRQTHVSIIYARN